MAESTEKLLAEIEALRKAVAEAQASAAQAKTATITVKAGQSGTVCVYGLGRYPVALYPAQWERLFAEQSKIAALIAQANANTAAWQAAVATAKAKSAVRTSEDARTK